MKNYDAILCECSLFAGISAQDLHALLGCLDGKLKRVQKGESIFCEGDAATHFGIVLSGAVRLVREDYYGNRSIVAHIAPAQLFAETYACAEVSALPVSVVADEASDVLLLDCRRVTQSCCNACAFHNQIIFNLLRQVASKNLMYDQKIQVTSKRSTREKLMTYLLDQAKLHGNNRFTIPYDRQELADYLEVERSGLSAEIGKLRREGILESEKRQFTLL